MAVIKIPSKNIFGKIENSKIRKNVVNNVSVDMTKISPNNEYETPVYNLNKVDGLFEYSSADGGDDNLGYSGYRNINYTDKDYQVFTLLKGEQSWIKLDIEIPRVANNKEIVRIYDKKKPNEENWIGLTVKYKKKSGNASCIIENPTYSIDLSSINYSSISDITEEYSDFEEEVYTGDIPSIEKEYKLDITVGNLQNKPTAISKIDLENPTNISSVSVVSSLDKFTINDIAILTSAKTYKLWKKYSGTYGTVKDFEDVELNGTYTYYEAESVEITIYGNTVGISLEDGTVTYGDGTKPFSLEGNELLQDSSKNGNTPTTQYLANQVFANYINGKETAVLKCSISDYYDYDTNELLISKEGKNGKKMTIDIGDEVLPMIYTNRGDTPMSEKVVDETKQPKTFSVVGKKIEYHGCPYQFLTIQEK
jgi:hypothetical protein